MTTMPGSPTLTEIVINASRVDNMVLQRTQLLSYKIQDASGPCSIVHSSIRQHKKARLLTSGLSSSLDTAELYDLMRTVLSELSARPTLRGVFSRTLWVHDSILCSLPAMLHQLYQLRTDVVRKKTNLVIVFESTHRPYLRTSLYHTLVQVGVTTYWHLSLVLL
jgi:hypothetical protein